MTHAATPSTTPGHAERWRFHPSLRRWIVRGLIRCFHQLRIEGYPTASNLGGALLVANHPSPIDAFLLAASLPRRVWFLLDQSQPLPWFWRWAARCLDIIPLSPDAPARERRDALHAAEEVLRRGDWVCLFGETQISRTGQMQPFRKDLEPVMKDLQAPIIPVCLDLIAGGFGRRWKEPTLAHRMGKLRGQAAITLGTALPLTATTAEIRHAVQELGSHTWRHRAAWMMPLHRSLVATARRYPFHLAMSDARSPRVGFLQALARTIYLARRLRAHWKGQENVGILLPPSVAGALVNFAALLMGKVPVNLNYTTSSSAIASCVQQCGLRTVISSEVFLAKVKVALPMPALLLEEVAAQPRPHERLAALVMALFLPVSWLERSLGCTRRIAMDDLATVIFSSGSTGEPKGVMLTHYNVASNIAQLHRVFHLTRHDRLLGVLPFFHSFGFTATLCLPATLGLGVVYHPTPLEAVAVGRLVRQHALTFLLTTPTFLQLYLNGCHARDLGSLRVVMVGAEKLTPRLAIAFEEKFGIRPLEGYGCTECAPAVAVNTLDVRAAGLHQVGGKRGSVGHPLPGVAIRIVDPVTEEPTPPGVPGLMLVHGPNVMQGYLGRPDLTAHVLRDGWYVTGDMAAVDEDGFLHITDRLSRFSKIGGEMVPHLKIEERLHELAGATQLTFVVASVPDERKGERLMVLHRLEAPALQACLAALARDDLPNLWKPRPETFIYVEAFPLLGTGKLDLRHVKDIALQYAA